MRIGAVFPQYEIGDDPAVIRSWAQAAEAAGYRHILAYDHVLGAGRDTRPDWGARYDSDTAFHEVFVLFGYLAAVTSHVELVTGVVILPQRQTVLVAKQAAEVDVLSGGRMRLGIGVGWNPVEYQALGENFHDRGARTAEQVEVMRALWAGEKVTYEGRWHEIDNAGIKPRPVRGTIPVWIGGSSDAALRRAGQIADGWLPQSPPDEDARAKLDQIRTYAREAGRDPADLGFEAALSLSEVPRDDWLDFALGWRDLGATHLCVNAMSLGLSGPEHAEVLREAAQILAPAQTR
jgi:probable F420-dependent oxidoreductase